VGVTGFCAALVLRGSARWSARRAARECCQTFPTTEADQDRLPSTAAVRYARTEGGVGVRHAWRFQQCARARSAQHIVASGCQDQMSVRSQRYRLSRHNFPRTSGDMPLALACDALRSCPVGGARAATSALPFFLSGRGTGLRRPAPAIMGEGLCDVVHRRNVSAGRGPCLTTPPTYRRSRSTDASTVDL